MSDTSRCPAIVIMEIWPWEGPNLHDHQGPRVLGSAIRDRAGGERRARNGFRLLLRSMDNEQARARLLNWNGVGWILVLPFGQSR